MNAGRVYPREEQVAELTRGHILPLAPLDEIHLILIAEELSKAWIDLLTRQRAILLAGDEAEVNSLMNSRLNSLIGEQGLWSQLVSSVARGNESLSFDGSHLEKRPDLSIFLTNRSPSFPLIVECKLIDASAEKKIKLYCDNGLLRFVKGEYAWAASEGFMLAYVRDGSTIDLSLGPFLAKSKNRAKDDYLTETLPESIDGTSIPLARSRHRRDFRHIGKEHADPGNIAIWHLWLVATA